MTMQMNAMTAALAAIRDYADDMSDYDILAKIVEAVEATADELAADEPHATATIATWRNAASALADIANELPEDTEDDTPEHIVDAINDDLRKKAERESGTRITLEGRIGGFQDYAPQIGTITAPNFR